MRIEGEGNDKHFKTNNNRYIKKVKVLYKKFTYTHNCEYSVDANSIQSFFLKVEALDQNNNEQIEKRAVSGEICYETRLVRNETRSNNR